MLVTEAHPTSTIVHIHVSGKNVRIVFMGGTPNDIASFNTFFPEYIWGNKTLGSVNFIFVPWKCTNANYENALQCISIDGTQERCLTCAMHVVFCSLEVHTSRHLDKHICSHLKTQSLDKRIKTSKLGQYCTIHWWGCYSVCSIRCHQYVNKLLHKNYLQNCVSLIIIFTIMSNLSFLSQGQTGFRIFNSRWKKLFDRQQVKYLKNRLYITKYLFFKGLGYFFYIKTFQLGKRILVFSVTCNTLFMSYLLMIRRRNIPENIQKNTTPGGHDFIFHSWNWCEFLVLFHDYI